MPPSMLSQKPILSPNTTEPNDDMININARDSNQPIDSTENDEQHTELGSI